ncbi:Dihydroorotate dehydrogenase [Symmachiella dynata]|uniref:Dihydroorotate dehydrogenase n=2 Tax=Symmachiella dynata TaxID=2527995 RepID=A0A517ZJJ7_9PLAN|nr:Dihydroorotate dehydrogenase [Symmachiella dynata]
MVTLTIDRHIPNCETITQEPTTMSDAPSPHLLPEHPVVDAALRETIARDYQTFAKQGLPTNLEAYLAERYHIDVASTYAGLPITNPFGKASGQLSMTARQVEEDVQAGLGFVVLKTVIAQDETGAQTMGEWAVKESRMVVEPITSQSGEPGWTVSWKGRGWWGTFDEYLQLIRATRQIAADGNTLIVPSCKYHLPTPEEDAWKESEYRYTTAKILEAWQAGATTNEPMPLEKDFSPTLAGSDRSAQQAKILEWLTTVPRLIRAGLADAAQVRVGLKVFNALFDDDFQLAMLQAIHDGETRPDFFIYGNRLFDPTREFDGKRGIAYGGPDLSDRNLRIMSRFQTECDPPLPWSATGDIHSGKMALEYALRGARSFQLHTFFQMPNAHYTATVGNKTQKALHELYFHPEQGLIMWMLHLAGVLGLPRGGVRLADVIGRGGC